MTDNLHLFVRPPKDGGQFFTVEDADKNVLAWAQTLQDIAIKWHRINDQKTIVEGLRRQNTFNGHPLLTLN